MSNKKRFLSPLLWSTAALALVLVACGPSAAPPPATRTPMPTFTPSPEGQQSTGETDTTTQTQQSGAQQNDTQQATQPVAQEPPTDTPAPAPTDPPKATDTPKPAPAEVVANSQINVRGGPGTNYAIVGAAAQGERFPVTGKSPDGSWWQITINGQTGWVFGQLVNAENTAAVAIAQNIPTAPPPPPTPIPQPTAVPQPTAAPQAAQPTQPPKSTYKFNVVVVSKCEPQAAGNWFEGTTYIGGQPQNGYKVVFSYAPDGPPITDPVQSGPHQGYPGWRTGYYSHIIHAHGPEAGNWYVWVVDDAGQRISDIGHWSSTGSDNTCNQAVVDFDSR
ncbi:MAG: SH3 domain-containing protein [Chloroflexi bacterium]|nr:SH3 domain-containing protein [Chloroflexota bacterium]